MYEAKTKQKRLDREIYIYFVPELIFSLFVVLILIRSVLPSDEGKNRDIAM